MLVNWHVSILQKKEKKLWITKKFLIFLDYFCIFFHHHQDQHHRSLERNFTFATSRAATSLATEVCDENKITKWEKSCVEDCKFPLSAIKCGTSEEEIIKFQQVPSIKINKGFAWCLSSLFVRMYFNVFLSLNPPPTRMPQFSHSSMLHTLLFLVLF